MPLQQQPAPLLFAYDYQYTNGFVYVICMRFCRFLPY